MKINLVMLSETDTDYLDVYIELIEFYYKSIQELGYEVEFNTNKLKPDYLNILVSYQTLSFNPQLCKLKYIVLQLEQLNLDVGGYYYDKHQNFFNDALPLMKNALQVWDYSPENQKFLKGFDIDCKLIPLGFINDLQRVQHSQNKDIDVLFYGSVHERRFNIIKSLEKSCNAVSHFGIYGKKRDNIIARSKIVLNIHSNADLKIMEQVRLFYLLTNKCFVISEESDSHPYENGIISLPYEQLIEGTIDWIKKDKEREEMALKGFEVLKEINSKELIRKALSEIKSILPSG
jgi:hypothetical protein